MGCVVNGPGEAQADRCWHCGNRGKGIIFRHGKIIRSAHSEAELLEAFMEELNTLLQEHEA